MLRIVRDGTNSLRYETSMVQIVYGTNNPRYKKSSIQINTRKFKKALF